jgi:hypothetical protein
MSEPKGVITHVDVLVNEHPDALGRGYQDGDPLRSVFTGEIDLPEDQRTAVRIVEAFFARDQDQPPGGTWDRFRRARLGFLYEGRPLRCGDVVILAEASAYASTDLAWEPLPELPALAGDCAEPRAALNDRQRKALEALEAMGGRATVYAMVQAGHLPVDPTKVDRFARQSDRIGWGRTLASLDRRGLVRGVHETMEPAGMSKVWEIIDG